MERIFRISDQCFQRSAEWDFLRQSCSEKSWETKMTIGHRRMIRIIENVKKFVAWRKITQNIHQCDIKPNREFKWTKNVISSTSLNTATALHFAIRKLARFNTLPGKNHYKALIRLLHHIWTHKLDYGLKFYPPESNPPIYDLIRRNEPEFDFEAFPVIVFCDSS